MAKTAGGPAASSFSNPRKTGWLYKHGGSGISSHWKKRWFIADDHYLFYYKTPTDKKPVGILCLQEYGSCQKADVKEWRKSFSFILGRAEGLQENSESGGNAPGKDYVLYSDSEGDMNAWIQALQEEMKSGSYISGGPVNYGGSSKVKVDQKAIEEVTKAASDGPKLTHLTAQRPRVKGRRPPKRYATYHEDDKDESPPDTPTSDRNATAGSPQPSPSASPTSKVKGHRPAVPLMPKQRSITSSSPPSAHESAKGTKILPTPPAKVAKVKEEGDTVPVPKQRPVPPKRPMKPRAATDAPVPPSRPVPAPRRVVGREGAASPASDLPPGENKDAGIGEAENETQIVEAPSTQETAQEIHIDEPKVLLQPLPEDANKEEQAEEIVENEPETNTTEQKMPTNDRETTETSPSSQMQEEKENNNGAATENANIVSECGREIRHVSSADEYEHMKPGVTKDKGQRSKKSPEYEDLDICKPASCTPSPQTDETKYTTPSPVTKQKETTYAVPHVTGESNAPVVPSTPQISLVVSENEENLTVGSSNQQQSEDRLKPFQIERDALGYSKVMKKKNSDTKVRSESPVQSDDEPPPPPLWTGMDEGLVTNSVPSTLHQAREILRLAQVMKREIEDMRREVQRELELARRERQDAELIKKNATEILRMAKEKLNQ